VPVATDLFAALAHGQALTYIGVIIPMGLFNLVGSLQNIESAEASGDVFPTAPSLAINGVGSVAASLFGSCFPTTIYIGHPGWKAMGARSGYSVANAAFFTVIALTGTLGLLSWAVPIEAGMAIVLWIGIVITSQAFEATPRPHAPAVVVGLLPGVAAWGALMAKSGLRAAGYGAPGGPAFSHELVDRFARSDTFIHGAFALEQGCIFTAMILSAVTVAVIEQRFVTAALWCVGAAALSAVGLVHAYAFTPGDTVGVMAPAWPWAAGYALGAAVFLAARWVTVPGGDAH
jgi:AGZA family xanthine/uracil permease-like MFS transporter